MKIDTDTRYAIIRALVASTLDAAQRSADACGVDIEWQGNWTMIAEALKTGEMAAVLQMGTNDLLTVAGFEFEHLVYDPEGHPHRRVTR